MTRPKPNKPGAGRPKGRVSITKSISMPEPIWADLDDQRGDISRGAFLTRVSMDWCGVNAKYPPIDPANAKCAGTDASGKAL